MPSSVTHFEIFAEDPAPLAEFYRKLFGWTIEQAPNREHGEPGFLVWDTDGRHALAQAASDSHPMASCLVPPTSVDMPSPA